MKKAMQLIVGVVAAAGIGTGSFAAGVGGLSVASVSPPARSLSTGTASAIRVQFDRPLLTSSVTSASFWAFGRWSGAVEGTISFSGGDTTATLTPDDPFTAGESVMVILSHDIEAQDGTFLRSAGYSFQFWTRAGKADLSFNEIDTLIVDPNDGATAYGGIASDLDNDGFMDITIVNEHTDDLRVFMNQADGTGLFDDFITPTSPIGNRASPSEPSDFNRDGNTDIAVVSIDDGVVSVLLGVGNGRFGPRQIINVGSQPRGIAVLDVDGDGDIDIVNTNSSSSNMSVILNDGSGVFGAATTFEAGVSNEWALAAADMTSDGILDIIVGGKSASTVVVMRGNGDGTFTFLSSTANVGQTWMLVCGDVNGDGHEDVATANSNSGSGTILAGDGLGNLTIFFNSNLGGFPLATDLADVDGDGDLDWLESNFSQDVWRLLLNDGNGAFSLAETFSALGAGSCTLPFDFDNDGDLDLALIDELADEVILMLNTGVPCPADIDDNDGVDFQDLLTLLASWGPCGICAADINGDGEVNFQDLLLLLATWGPCV